MKIQMRQRTWLPREALLILVSSLFVAMFFANIDGTNPSLGSTPGLNFATEAKVSEYTSWLPLAVRISEGTLFPILPSVNTDAQGIAFIPYISLWIHGAMIATFGINETMAIGHIVIPLLCFVFLILIFRRSLPILWSISLAGLSLISYTHLPFREFLVALVAGKALPASIDPPAVAQFPFPGLSLLLFLSIFYISIKPRRLDFKWLLTMSFLWGLQGQIHILNALFGLTFWFLFFPFQLARQQRNLKPDLWRVIAWNALVATLALSPTIYALCYTIDFNLSLEFFAGSQTARARIVNELYVLAYFAMPVALASIAVWWLQADTYDFFYRFLPVYVLLITEAIVILCSSIFQSAIDPLLVFSRLGMLFFHFYYLVPILFLLTSRLRTFHYDQKLAWRTHLRTLLDWIANRLSLIYLPTILAVLGLFMMTSNQRHSTLEDLAAISYRKQLAEVSQLLETTKYLKGTVVFETAETNLLIPIATQLGTLWVNRFSNRVTTHEVIERLALYAKIFQWSEDDFIRFLKPGHLQKGKSLVLAPNWAQRHELIESGLGYWLVQHKAPLANSEVYESMIRDIFNQTSLQSGLAKFDVKAIVARSPLKGDIPIKQQVIGPFGTVYLLN